MSYSQISSIIFDILFGILSLLLIHYVIFSIVGIFFKKKFPHTETKLKYGIIIPARNEEKVVANLIKSVQQTEYSQDKLQIFVIAHNCTDNTAQIAREAGATVYEYSNPEENTMGYAFKYLFERIKEDWGTENYDGFFLFNADNVLDRRYFDKMNDAFVANNKQCVITSFRNSKNFGSNIMSAMYGLYFMSGCRMESRGRTVLGCSTRIQGTGYVINSDVVKDDWPYVTLTEDWEFTADQILRNNKILFCDDAIFYDEQPTNFKVMWKQRLRWSKGHLLVCITRFKDLVKGLFKSPKKGGTKYKISTYDILINIMPICVISSSLFILQFILVAITPIFEANFLPIWQNYLFGLLRTLLTSYITIVITSILLFIVEHKRIKNVKLIHKIFAALLWPIFMFLSIPMEFVALFTKEVRWSEIPHPDTTSIDDLKTQEIDISKIKNK